MSTDRVIAKGQARLDVIAQANGAIDNMKQFDENRKGESLLIFNTLFAVSTKSFVRLTPCQCPSRDAASERTYQAADYCRSHVRRFDQLLAYLGDRHEKSISDGRLY